MILSFSSCHSVVLHRTLLINLLNDIPDTWPILVVSTWDENSGASSGADADAMLSDRDVCSFGNIGRGPSLPSSSHGTGRCLQQLGLRLHIFILETLGLTKW